MLSLERKRSERSRKPFLLMLIDLQNCGDGFDRHHLAKKVTEALHPQTRDTDIKGWYKYGWILGIIFSEISFHEKNVKVSQKFLADKCTNALKMNLDTIELDRIIITWHVFPGRFEKAFTEKPEHTKIYPDVFARMERKKAALVAKRMIDFFGSFFALALFAPIYLAFAVLIKIDSPGPVFYRQERIGMFGKRFILLKFRSMHTHNDSTIHQNFVKSLIHGENKQEACSKNFKKKETYKITMDPRVTSVGKLLRKTSLDELPQFINVLLGDMSLVGPRPPIPYECAEYDVWHRKRLLEMKPGITGLWQVKGRSATSFDDMVRMDIKYLQEWSLWLDFKILLETPWVVLKGKGAY
jgi:lipopolysaccharide/colanic/teichoic acid biosynthesis glycosyltransferase